MLRPAILCAVVLLGQGWAFAQGAPPVPPARAAETQTCSVEGRVVRANSGEPLKKAHITLLRTENPESPLTYEAQTDEAGHFAIQGMEAGRYRLYVSRTGYSSQEYGQGAGQRSGALMALDPGKRMDGLLFRLVPWAVIAGRITDEDGEPLPGIQVQAMRSGVRDGKRTFLGQGYAETNDLGEYRLWDLRKGRYYVKAIYRNRQRWMGAKAPSGNSSKDAAGYAPVFYPGTTDAAHAATVEVIAGQEVPGVDFVLLPTRAVKVRGHVFNAILGRPETGCCAILGRADDSGFYDFSNQAMFGGDRGDFEFDDVVPGSYFVLAYSLRGGKRHFTRRRIEVGDTDLDGVDLTISRGADIRGRVIVEGAGKLDLSKLSVSLNVREESMFGQASGEVQADGTFAVTEVSEDTYDVHVGGAEGFYLKSARAGGQESIESGLVVGAAGTKGPLEIVLSASGAVVEGVATDSDGLPVPGATVVLIPEGERRKVYRFYREGATDQFGKFIFRDVRPGGYKLFSWRDVEYGVWQDPEFLKPIEDKGVKVDVEERGHLTVQLTVISPVADKPSP